MFEQALDKIEDHIHYQFQHYHLANYHDGDDTFATSIFDVNAEGEYSNEFVRDCFDHFYHSFKYLVSIGGNDLVSKLEAS